jgi:hypothetical protein
MRFASLWSFPVLILLGGGVASDPSMQAQSLATATRGAEFTAFGGYTGSSTDYGYFAPLGMTAGGNFTLYPKHWFVDPSVELRFDYAHSTGISEHGYFGGPRLQMDILEGRVHPYVDYLFGKGTVSYHPAINGVTSTWGPAKSYGGGVDFDLTPHFSVKADFKQQSWNMGKNVSLKPDGSDFTLAPRAYTLGVTYHFQFSGLKRQNELR